MSLGCQTPQQLADGQALPNVLQACLSWWSTVSPFGGFGSTAALAFVLIVAAIKALLEDAKRHQEDRRTNKSVAHVMLPDGEPQQVPSRQQAAWQWLPVPSGRQATDMWGASTPPISPRQSVPVFVAAAKGDLC